MMRSANRPIWMNELTHITDVPPEVMAQIFLWIHPMKVVKFRLLARAFDDVLTSISFGMSSLKKCGCLDMDRTELRRSENIEEFEGALNPLEYILFRGHPAYRMAYTKLLKKKLKEISLCTISLPKSSIPTCIGGLENLRVLRLRQVALIGNIPRDIKELSNLETLDLSNNSLDGRIPEEIGDLRMLECLDLGANQLRYHIPASLGRLDKLQALFLHNNHLHGPIPKELGNLANLLVLNLNHNQLDGSIPDELGSLQKLCSLILSNNRLSSIPESLCQLSDLVDLKLSNNRLSRPVPSAIISWIKEKEFNEVDSVLNNSF
ncbi:hypothetical protein BDR26DRAFT_860340 [Obelidium mucronatum]|nr:hypothetical protein BDR26DRAFT_860340 [Obelidium mucronatum]